MKDLNSEKDWERRMNELALFAGAGGGVLGSLLLGHRIVCAVEINPYCREVLLRRQEEGFLPPFPIWDDIRTFDGTAWRGKVDIVSAGFPCQPFSVAGKQKGEHDDRNMWPDTIRCIREVRPRYCLLENVPNLLTHEYVRRIYGDLAESGYDIQWDCLSAASQGAPHIRDRLWIVAHANNNQLEQSERCQQNKRRRTSNGCKIVSDSHSERCEELRGDIAAEEKITQPECDSEHVADAYCGNCRQGNDTQQKRDFLNRKSVSEGWWETEPGVGWLLPDGVAVKLGENINEIMSGMWKAFAEEKIWEAVRGSWRFHEAEILQPLMYGYWADKRKAHCECNREKNSPSEEVFLRDMQDIGKSWHTPQGQEPIQQQCGELADAMLFVSYIFASQTGTFGKKEAETAMQYLRQSLIQVWTLFDTSYTFQEAWRSLDGSWKASLVLGRWVFEPPIPRTCQKLSFRVDRLKALGNGQVPRVVEKAWKTLHKKT